MLFFYFFIKYFIFTIYKLIFLDGLNSDNDDINDNSQGMEMNDGDLSIKELSDSNNGKCIYEILTC